MSQATPMSTDRRLNIYARPHDGHLTARQHRQLRRMDEREMCRDGGALPWSGATGARIRRPIPRPGLAPERGSIRTHIAEYCKPCPAHVRPRLHRTERGAA